jgi:hypothetical protein
MASRYFKIIGANANDQALIENLLVTKSFYPEATSTPALPALYDALFNYKQFLLLYEGKLDKYPIVYTRQSWTVAQFNVQAIPPADWTVVYGLSIAPTVEEVSDSIISVNLRRTKLYSFLSYDYQLYNNI